MTPAVASVVPRPGSPWRVKEAATFLRSSERHLNRLIADGLVKSILLGRSRLIPDAKVRRIAGEGVG